MEELIPILIGLIPKCVLLYYSAPKDSMHVLHLSSTWYDLISPSHTREWWRNFTWIKQTSLPLPSSKFSSQQLYNCIYFGVARDKIISWKDKFVNYSETFLNYDYYTSDLTSYKM